METDTQARTQSVLEKVLVILPWAALPILGWRFAATWDHLPERMAVHFDLNGQPNGWQSPHLFAAISFVLTIGVLSSMTTVIVRSLRRRTMWQAMTVVAYVSTGMLIALPWQLLDHAAYGVAMNQLWPVPAIVPLGMLTLAIAFSMMSSQQPRPSADALVIAEERHRSFMQMLFVLPGMGIGIWLATVGHGAPRILGIFLIAAMLWVTIGVLSGFRYVIRTDGVQITGFLLPLRFVARSSIRGYRSDRWRGLGYGVRLTSTGTAYIWGGRKTVNISTESGDVLLGHENPERLVADLDKMMNAAR